MEKTTQGAKRSPLEGGDGSAGRSCNGTLDVAARLTWLASIRPLARVARKVTHQRARSDPPLTTSP